MQSVVSKLNENFRQPVRQTSVIEGEKLSLLMKASDRFVLCQLISDWERRESVSAGNPGVICSSGHGWLPHTSIQSWKAGGDACGSRQNVYTVF